MIADCTKCSATHTGKCEKCSSGMGLSDVTDDSKAGGKCVKCLVEGCSECDLKKGESKAKCSECTGDDVKLREKDGGEQVCFGFGLEILKVVISVFLVGCLLD